jgi:hypothetical protein
MPNSCGNHLSVSGPAKDVRDFVTVFQQRGFGAHVPEPSNPGSDDDDDYDWDEWRCTNWGTKWNVESDDIVNLKEEECDGELTVTLSFDTAWSPPEPLLRSVVSDFTNLPLSFTLFYLEEGMAFCGTLEGACKTAECREFTVERGRSLLETRFYRKMLSEFQSEAQYQYTFVAQVASARLKITPEMEKVCADLKAANTARLPGQDQEIGRIVAECLRCTFHPRRIPPDVACLSSWIDDQVPAYEIEVDSASWDGNDVIISATARLELSLRSPFFSLADFWNDCDGSGSLSKGLIFQIDLAGLPSPCEIDDHEFLTFQPDPATFWNGASLF